MANKKNKKKKKKQSVFGRSIKLGIKIFALVFINLCLLFGIFLAVRYGGTVIKMHDEAQTLVRESTTETFRQTETSLVYDNNEDLISVLKGEKDVYYINYEDIPKYVKEAVIAIEDKKFFKHSGVDVKANLRAVFALIKNKGAKTQGGSTITQQLSRNIFLTHEKSFERKVKEIFIALELEKKYSKSQILEFYLNNIYFANGYYGIQAASKGYFSKSVDELSLSQMAFLCAIPNNPTLYDPRDNMDNTIKRRDRILKQMFEDGDITSEEYSEATAEEITLVTPTIDKNNYVETYIYSSAIKALMKAEGFEFKYKFDSTDEQEEYEERYTELYNQYQQTLYTAGYRIYTSIDLEKQELLQESIDDTLASFTDTNSDGIYELQGAATCIDNDTGLVVAIVGGRYQDTAGYTLNRAFQSFRQPGSSIKPLIVYTPSFERSYTPNTIVNDTKIEDGPSNSNGRYLGKVTVRTAVEKSINTIAWQLFDELTPTVGLNYLYNMNFSKISRKDYGLASSLGGLTNGVSTVEMASGYATIENDGIFREPTCIVKILNSEGEEIVSNTPEEKKIYDVNAARMMTNVLEGVVTNGTAKGLKIPNMATAGKTGTTNDKKDGWFVGYTPYYTTSVWVGYDMPKTLSDLYGGTYPGQIWYQFMKQIHEGLDSLDFPMYQDNSQTVEDSKEEETTEEEETSEEEEEMDAGLEDNVEDGDNGEDEDNNDYGEEDDENDYGEEEIVNPTETPKPTVKPTHKPTEAPVATPTPDQGGIATPDTGNGEGGDDSSGDNPSDEEPGQDIDSGED